MLQEISPLRIKPLSHTVEVVDRAWNKRAGLVIFEAPAGVGYSDSNADLTITDEVTVKELLLAIEHFLTKHANLLKN